MDACLDDNQVLDLVQGTLATSDAAHVQKHLDGCERCRAEVAEVAANLESSPGARTDREWEALRPGERVGRYILREPLGAGAMGFVYSAFDPELGRSVALKLLRGSPSEAMALRARLLREAQVLARLSHPNVVVVHEVAAFGSRLFVALELVEGGTLGDWLSQAPRSPAEILRAFRQAGEGLAAAHAAGLVHRDFKPDNVLMGGGAGVAAAPAPKAEAAIDGRVRVTDFGLAREEALAATDELDAPSPSLPLVLTATGQLVGTPAYMAPEQLQGHKADARSDQFAFCVALYEALFGRRPFAGRDLESLKRALLAGEIQPTPAGRRVPRWVRRIVLRGLARDPAHRWPSMRALLDALDRGPLVTRGRLAVACALVLALAAGAWQLRARNLCAAAAAEWPTALDAGAAAALRPSIGAVAAATVERAFAAFARAGSVQELEACRAARERGEASEAVYALQRRCLDDRRAFAAAVAAALSTAQASAAAALDAASALPGLEGCQSAQGLAAFGAIGDDGSTAALRAELRRATALALAGSPRALEALNPLPAQARALHSPALEAQALLARAKAGHDEGAEEADLHAAATAAFSARDDATAADAWTALALHAGIHRGRAEDARVFASYAQAALERLPGSEAREAELFRVRAEIALADKRPDDAAAALARARALWQRARPNDGWRSAALDAQAADIERARGRYGDALLLARKAREGIERVAGPGSAPARRAAAAERELGALAGVGGD